MLVNLTPKQKKIYEFIKKFYDEKGYSPTLKEISKKFKTTTTTVHQFVKALEKKEFLHKTKWGREWLGKLSLTDFPMTTFSCMTNSKIRWP